MRLPRIAFLFVLAVAAAVVVTGAASASNTTRVVGHVYVDDNTAPVNTVAGFDRLADGTLTPMPGSPFAVGGSGTGHPDASQGSLQLSDDGRYLLAVDAGSNEISVLRIKPDGSFQPASAPVASGGIDPVSIGLHGSIVYVANAGPGSSPGDTNYTGFRLNPGGQLRPIPDSTYVLPNDSKPGQVLFNGDGTRVAGTRIATSLIDSFTVGGTDVSARRPARRTTPRRSRRRRATGSSEASSARPIRTSCSSPMRMSQAEAPLSPVSCPASPMLRTGRSTRSEPRSPMTAAQRAGSRSVTTAGSFSS